MSVDGRARPTVRVALGGTAIFTLIQTLATIWPDGPAASVAVVWSGVLFAVGSIGFVAAFVVAAGRSRDESVTMAGVVWLTNSVPAEVARVLRGAFVLQCVVALVTAGIRPFTAVAFGALAPMFGLGCIAWFGARYGSFAPILTTPDAGPTRGTAAPRAPEPSSGQPTPERSGTAEPAPREDPDDFDQLFGKRRRSRRR